MYDIVGTVSRKDKIKFLNNVKSILNAYGWIQGSHGNCGTGFCLDGAILFTVPPEAREDIEYELAKTIEDVVSMSVYGVVAIWRYNDDHAKNKDEVIRVIDRTIERLNA